MGEALSSSAQRVQDALDRAGVATRVVEYTEPARTSAQAAAVLGCTVGQIAKSLVFRAASGRAVLVIASGANRVDEAKVAAKIGEPIGKADADFVRAHTGFAIGGVAPAGHTGELAKFVDRALAAWPEIWAAGGHAHTVFRLTYPQLLRLTGGTEAELAE